MKNLVRRVVLLNRRTGDYEPAELFEGTDQQNMDDFRRLWRPMLKDRRSEFRSWIEAADANAQDSHWDWVRKTEEADHSLQFETFAVECAGITQGMMRVDVTDHVSRLQGELGRQLVYIDLLATAPWNRPRFVERPVYKGIGPLFVVTAISLGVELEYQGRVGLHSLPQSRDWYLAQGFTQVAYDEPKRMYYFEMSEAQASKYIAD